MKLILPFLFLLISVCLDAQNISFRHLTIEEGLSDNSVMSICQDSKGRMWFATRNGLNMYDGARVRIYRNEKGISDCLAGNLVEQVICGGKDTLFVKTRQGVSLYDVRLDKFTTIFTENSSSLYYEKSLFLSAGDSIMRYSGGKFDKICKITGKATTKLLVYNDTIMAGTDSGLYMVTKDGCNDWSVKELLPDLNVSYVYLDSKERLWVCDLRSHGGVYLMSEGTVKRFKHDKHDIATLPSDFIQCCVEDKFGKIWIGTFNGLALYDDKTGSFTRFLRKETIRGLTNSSVWSLFCDKQGTMWAGTFYGGVNMFDPYTQVYSECLPSAKERDGLSSGVVSRMMEDNDGNLWIGTEGGGLNVYYADSQSFRWYKSVGGGDKKGLTHNNVKSLYYDDDKNILWIGTFRGGLNKLDLSTGQFKHYENLFHDYSISDDIILEILPYKEKLLIATQQDIIVFNPNNGEARYLLSDGKDRYKCQNAVDLLIDKRGHLWIISLKGIFFYDFKSGKLTDFLEDGHEGMKLSSCHVNSVYEDASGRLWFCTDDSGVDVLDFSSGSSRNINKTDSGLVSNQVYDICEYLPGFMLITTSDGISVFDIYGRECHNYTNLPQLSLKHSRIFSSHSGRIYIGGLNGLFFFERGYLSLLRRKYDIYPSRLMVNGKEVYVNDDFGILTESIPFIDRLTFKPGQDIFSIEYSVSNYSPYRMDKFEYRLSGLSDDWISMDDSRSVTYTSLSPGDYTLFVRSVNDKGEIVAMNKIDISVTPPFYRTIWAYMFYVLCALVLAFYLINSYLKRIKLREKLIYEQKHIKDIEELNRIKLELFTDISHEFRTPLTLIEGQIEILMRSDMLTRPLRERIVRVYRNCLQMGELITELLDFRKQEQGKVEIKVSEHDIVAFMKEIYNNFLVYSEYKDIDFTLTEDLSEFMVWYDEKQMRKVFNNILSNAFKYTKEGGNINVSVSKDEGYAVIKVKDTGMGISSENIKNIFNNFYQAYDSNEQGMPVGSGIGLAYSKEIVDMHGGSIDVESCVGEGSEFIIRLRQGNSHFSEEQIEDSTDMVTCCEKEYANGLVGLIPFDSHVPANDGGQFYKMMIVEDNEELLDMLVNIMEGFYKVETAHDGNEALEKMKTFVPDIVVSDVLMPGMSGTELCYSIKHDKDYCHIPVLLLTARTSVEHTVEGLKVGADDYINKPFNIDILISRCHNLINNRLILQERFGNHPMVQPQILATNETDHDFIDEMMNLLDSNIDNPDYNADMLAKEIGMSRTKFYNKVKAVTGQTPLEFIQTMRLKRAAVMLRDNKDMSITDISYSLGFTSVRHMSRCFKDKFGKSPQTYRREGE